MIKKDNTMKKRKDGKMILEARIDAGKIEALLDKLSDTINKMRPTLIELQQAFTILQVGYFMNNCVSKDGYADLSGMGKTASMSGKCKGKSGCSSCSEDLHMYR